MGEEISEYRQDILDHMERMEAETLPIVASIEIQTEIQWDMRGLLLEFLVEAHMALSLLPETLFLTINILDRYCSKVDVLKRYYQLLGCAALLIAAKYLDKINTPTIKNLCYLCGDFYKGTLFVQMEKHILHVLGWVLGYPTVITYLQLVLQEAPNDPEAEAMARYLSEIALFHKDFVSIRPSEMARTAYALACHMLGRPHSGSTYKTLFGYIPSPELMETLALSLFRPSQVLMNKYSTQENLGVAVTLVSILYSASDGGEASDGGDASSGGIELAVDARDIA